MSAYRRTGCSDFALASSKTKALITKRFKAILTEVLDALSADTTSLSSSSNNTGVSDNNLLREGVFSDLKSLDVSGTSRCL